MSHLANWKERCEGVIRQLDKDKLLRELQTFIPTSNPTEVLLERPTFQRWLQTLGTPVHAGWRGSDELLRLKLFSLNDYLGLSNHPAVQQAVSDTVRRIGNGPRASPLVGGYTHLHRQLEQEIAILKGTEDAQLLASGFAANLTAITALATVGSRVAIFSDQLNHASIIDGVRLACRTNTAVLHVYRHSDMDHLDSLLDQCPAGTLKLVVTDSMFSMDGDFADLRALAELKKKHGFLLVIDEAHATLVCGDRGAGEAEAQGVEAHIDVYTGNFSKAFGSQGGYIACTRQMKQLMLNKGRSYVFSTSLPAPVVAASAAALKVATEDTSFRSALWRGIHHLSSLLGVEPRSPVVPLIIGSEADTLEAAGKLLSHLYHVPAIRPPTVPEGTCRLRVTLSAAHSLHDITSLATILQQCDIHPINVHPLSIHPVNIHPVAVTSGAGSRGDEAVVTEYTATRLSRL